MALKRLVKKCRECPFADKCNHKQMEALGYLPEPLAVEAGMPSAAKIAQPILRETVNTIVDGKVVKIYKDDLEKELYKSLYSNFGLQYGG